VQVRVAPDFKTEFHVDTDDGNAADIVNGSIVEIVDASCISPLAPQMANGDRIPPSIPDGSFVGEVTDPNLLKNICAIATGQTCTREQIETAVAAVKSAQAPANSVKSQENAQKKSQENAQDSSAGIGSGQASAGGSITRKTLITAGDLEKYIQTGICVTKDVILSPLARDEAIARGIAISYER